MMGISLSSSEAETTVRPFLLLWCSKSNIGSTGEATGNRFASAFHGPFLSPYPS